MFVKYTAKSADDKSAAAVERNLVVLGQRGMGDAGSVQMHSH